MISDLPVESVNGQQEWEWNEQRSSRNAPTESGGASDGRPDGNREKRTKVRISSATDRKSDQQRRDVALEREVDRLQAELERKEERLQNVIERYERLLSEKDREIAERARSASDDEADSTVRTVVERCVLDR